MRRYQTLNSFWRLQVGGCATQNTRCRETTDCPHGSKCSKVVLVPKPPKKMFGNLMLQLTLTHSSIQEHQYQMNISVKSMPCPWNAAPKALQLS
jgi:hypothetical protein